MPFSLIPFLLLAIPILEIAVFIMVGGVIGTWWTLATILITAVVGSILLRLQGFKVIEDIRQASQKGGLPGKALGHGAMILAAGILLLTPGLVTDTIGFLLFVPFIRSAIWHFLAAKVVFVATNSAKTGFSKNGFGKGDGSRSGFGRQDDDVIDLDEKDYRRRRKNPRKDQAEIFGQAEKQSLKTKSEIGSKPGQKSKSSNNPDSPWKNS